MTIGLECAYYGGQWVRRFLDIVRPDGHRYICVPNAVILPDQLICRWGNFVMVLTDGITNFAHLQELISGAGQVDGRNGVRGKVNDLIDTLVSRYLPLLEEAIGGITPQHQFLLAGHSAGGAFTHQLASRLISNTYRVPNANIVGSYNFAGPKPGNQEFAEYLNGIPTYSIRAWADPVPLFPPPGIQLVYNLSDLWAQSLGYRSIPYHLQYVHVPDEWLLTDRGNFLPPAAQLTQTGREIQQTFSLARGLLQSSSGRPPAHEIETYINSLADRVAADNLLRPLLALTTALQAALPITSDPEAIASSPAVGSFTFTPTPPVPPQVNNQVLAGTVSPSFVSGAVNGRALQVLPTDDSDTVQHLFPGYDRQLLKTVLSAGLNLLRRDAARRNAGVEQLALPDGRVTDAMKTVLQTVSDTIEL